jgi:thiamine-phosphate diphosphorylase
VLADGGPVLCVVTHGERLAARLRVTPQAVEDALVTQVREAAAAGVTLVQIREPDLETGDLFRLVERCVAVVAGSTTRVLVNDRGDVALAAGAHGVHLRADSYPAQRMRAIAPEGFIIGRSVHDPVEAGMIARGGAVDYLIFGTVFATASKPSGHPVGGLAALADAVAAARPIPVLAIGGIAVETARNIRAVGAAGLAAIGLFLPGDAGETTLAETVRRLRDAFDTAADLGEE